MTEDRGQIRNVRAIHESSEYATDMEKVNVNLGERGYTIYIGDNILFKLGELLIQFELSKKIAVISNPTVWKFYGIKIIKSLKSAGFSPVKIIIPDGEKYKNLRTVEKIYTEMLKTGIDRKGCVVALGGGVVGDIAGFVAATYMRGVKFVQVPTTLLAQMDASIGGKTGVDHKLGKNLVGAFYQPMFVLVDISTLDTLPEREFRAGLAEVIKYGVIRDSSLFKFLEENREQILNRDRDALNYIISRSCEIKARIVEQDEREETGLRSILNFGHTIGHAIEATTGYRKYLHGEAVAMGMMAEAKISDVLTDCKNRFRIAELINGYFSFKKVRNISNDISHFIGYDKKISDDEIKIFLIRNIGQAEIDSIEIKRLKKIINAEEQL